jgi:hypothetical protein
MNMYLVMRALDILAERYSSCCSHTILTDRIRSHAQGNIHHTPMVRTPTPGRELVRRRLAVVRLVRVRVRL